MWHRLCHGLIKLCAKSYKYRPTVGLYNRWSFAAMHLFIGNKPMLTNLELSFEPFQGKYRKSSMEIYKFTQIKTKYNNYQNYNESFLLLFFLSIFYQFRNRMDLTALSPIIGVNSFCLKGRLNFSRSLESFFLICQFSN